MQTSKSEALFSEAKELIPGGVNSPVRAFKSVGGQPRFIDHAAGSHIWDVDGNSYIDYVCSWGPLIAGHAHPEVVEAIKSAAEKGTSYGAPTELEIELARMVVDALPSVEMVRFVNSGTEAGMSALRLARAYTGRNKIIKLTGCYHGHSDMLLVQAGSGVMTLSLPDSPGVPPSAAQDTLTAPYNDLKAVEEVFEANFNGVAALILEPVVGNVGVVPPKEGYLAGLRDLCNKYGTLLIFDEVITGFRVAYGGAQSLYGVMPDLTCLGKIIGGGLPVGAYGGRREIMEMVAPMGPVYQAGTLSGNPLAMTAGIATLCLLRQPGAYEHLEAMSVRLAEGLGQAAREAGVPVQQNRVGSMQSTFFTSEPVTCYETSVKSDTKRFSQFHTNMLENGVYLAPSQFESTFVSLAHTTDDIDQTIEAAKKSLQTVVTK